MAASETGDRPNLRRMPAEKFRTTGIRPDAPIAARRATRNPWVAAMRHWIDSSATDDFDEAFADRIDWLRTVPFVAMHVACVDILWVGVSATALNVAASLYAVRMFALTGFYHRSIPRMTAAIMCGSPSSRSARAGTTIIISFPRPAAKAFAGGKSTSLGTGCA